PLVPLLEHLGAFLGRHAQAIAHNAEYFGDHLHVAILDAVVDHLDEVASAAFTQICAAAFAVELGSDCRKHRLGIVPLLLGAADHDRRAMACALFTAGNADAEIAD